MPRFNEVQSGHRLLIVSLYRLFGECLAAALKKAGHWSIATADFDKSTVVEQVQKDPSAIILLKNDQAYEQCLELTSFLVGIFQNVKIIVLGVPNSEAFVAHYFEAGAHGYIPEQASLSDVEKAIHQVAQGEVVCFQSAAPALLGRLAKLHGAHCRLHQFESETLSLREREILEFMAIGFTNSQIGARLSISAHTVKNHVHNILGKLRVNKRLLAIQEAYRRGWLHAGGASGKGLGSEVSARTASLPSNGWPPMDARE